MTFQPPPGTPQPGDQPPPPGSQPPSPGQWGPPPAGGPARSGGFDPKTINPLDWGIVGAGVLAFIFSLFDYYTASVRGFGSSSESAWHGFFGWFATLLAVVGAAVVAISLFAPHIKLPVAARLAGLGAFALATISVIIALFVFPEDVPDIAGVDTGRGFGYWASLVVIIAGLVLSLMRFQATGGQLPGALQGKIPNVGGYGPQGGLSGGSAPHPGPGQQAPPPPGYGQQPPPPPGYGQQPPPPPGYGPPQ